MQPEMYLVFSGYRVIVEWQDYLFGIINHVAQSKIKR
jgi:hypothetical protein